MFRWSKCFFPKDKIIYRVVLVSNWQVIHTFSSVTYQALMILLVRSNISGKEYRECWNLSTSSYICEIGVKINTKIISLIFSSFSEVIINWVISNIESNRQWFRRGRGLHQGFLCFQRHFRFADVNQHL